MTLLTFPSAPVNGQLYPAAPAPGQAQYEWSATNGIWVLLGSATTVLPGTYGDSTNVGQFTVDSQGRLTFAANVPISGAAGGTVTQVSTGLGLTGGPITGTGTISLLPATQTVIGGVYPDEITVTVNGSGQLSVIGGGGATLQQVSDNGATTTNVITIGGLISNGTLLPGAHETYDLGSPTQAWQTLYCKNTSIYLGPYKLSVVGGSLEIDGSSVSSGGTVTDITTGSGLSGGTITESGTIDLSDTSVTPGSYTNSSITVDQQGRLTAASSGSSSSGTVSSITAGTGLDGGTITTTGTVSLANTAVTPGSYTYSSLTVDAQGRLTAASSGTSPITCLDFDTKGDLLAGFGSDSYGTVAVGTNGQVLMANSACTPGIKWATITQCLGTVTSITAGTGLSGGAITSSGTIALCAATPYVLGGVMGIANDACFNTALGYDAGGSFTGGSGNTAIGRSAGSSISVGEDNTFIGAVAGASSVGSNNIGIGVFSLGRLNSPVCENIAIGNYAMSLASGSCNLAIGPGALGKISGPRNIAIGNGALLNATTADNNIGIGWQALLTLTTGLNNLEIGANNGISNQYSPPFGVTTECNRVVLGSTATTNAYIQVAWTLVSDERDKTEIQPIALGLDFVSQLDPISYRFKESRESEVATGPTRYGFSAQQVLGVEGENPVVVDIEDPNKLKITDANLIPVLVKAIQELQAQVNELRSQG